MKRLVVGFLLLCAGMGLAQGFPSSTAEAKFVRQLFRLMNIATVACPDDVVAAGGAALCGHYSGGAERFKSVWHSHIQTYPPVGVRTLSGWEGAGMYTRAYQLNGAPSWVSLDGNLVVVILGARDGPATPTEATR